MEQSFKTWLFETILHEDVNKAPAYMQAWIKEMANAHIQVEAHVSWPGKGWGYAHAGGEWQGRPKRNQWIKRGEKAIPAFDTEAEWLNPQQQHPDYHNADYTTNVPSDFQEPAQTANRAVSATIRPAQPVAPVSPSDGNWWLARAKIDTTLPDHYAIDHRIKKGQHIALKSNSPDDWAYVTIWKGKLQWHNAHIPAQELSGLFERVVENGRPVRGNKASDLAKDTHQEEKKEFKPTEEQEAISSAFGKEKDHIVINALAGTGKTTMLKELANTYGAPSEKWLYLVFNSKNQQEASKEFPKFVDVYTTNAYAGKVLENNRVVKPTDRMIKVSKKQKIGLILDGSAYRTKANKEGMPYWNSGQLEKSVKWYMRSVWTEFNTEVKKLVGLAKSYNVSVEDAEKKIKKIASEYDINSELEKVKERLEKDRSVDQYNSQISKFMGIRHFLEHDFLDNMIKCAAWVLEKSQPHAIDQEFEQTHEGQEKLQEPITRNLKHMRDFDDDLWYAARHANEIDWSKPKKYEVVLVDEVQDFNRSQKVILQKLAENGARIVAVGDPNQGMYRFRGADDKAFKDITEMLKSKSSNPNSVEKTLTKNFRSKPGIIDHSNANTIVKNLIAGREEDPDDLAHISNRELKYGETIARLAKEYSSIGEMKKQTAFIARTNEPLAKAAMDLLKHKIPFVIYGKDMGKDLISLVDRIVAQGSEMRFTRGKSSIYEFRDELKDFVEGKKEKWAGKSAKAGELKDLLEAEKALNSAMEISIDSLKEKEDQTVDEFKSFLKQRLGGTPDRMSSREEAEHNKRMEELNPVVLTTAHKSKGLEFDRVFELTPSMYPHPRSKLDADIAQEENARYVAGTRAKDEYHVVDDEEEE